MSKPTSPPDPNSRTLADLCKLTGLSQGRIAQAVKEGFVAKTGRGTYSVSQAIKGLFSFFDSHWGKLPTYDNVEQCSEATGIPVSLIKSIRRKSKEPFKSQRIHLGPLLREVFSETGDGDDTNWKGVKEKWDALYSKARTERELWLTLDRNEIGSLIAQTVSQFFFELDRLAELEAPAALKGQTEEGIRAGLIAAFNRYKDRMRESLSKVAGEEEKL